MEPDLSISTLKITTTPTVSTTTQLHQAWHLLSLLLLSLNRRSLLTELASKCRDPIHCVEYLCSILPILLTEDSRFVSPSPPFAFVIFQKFMSNLNRVDFGVFRPKRALEDVLRTYSRRRKRLGLESEVMPVSKKRVVLQDIDGKLEF